MVVSSIFPPMIVRCYSPFSEQYSVLSNNLSTKSLCQLDYQASVVIRDPRVFLDPPELPARGETTVSCEGLQREADFLVARRQRCWYDWLRMSELGRLLMQINEG